MDKLDLAAEEAASLAEENERLRAELEAARARGNGPPGRHRIRRWTTGVLVVLTSLCVVVATIGIWTQRTLADTDRYVALVAPLADDPAVTDALAARLTEEIFVALDVQDRIESAIASIPRIPPAATFLAGPVTDGARNLVQERVSTFLASETFAEMWVAVNRQVHDKLQALLNGDYEQLPNVQVDGGEVRLNLISVAAQIIGQLAQRGVDALGIEATIPSIPPDLDASAALTTLSTALGVSLPEDFGQVTVLTVDQLSSYQDTVRMAKRLVALFFVLALLLLAATILVSVDRRRAIVWLGSGIAIALFLGGVFLRKVRGNIVDSITAPGAKAAAADVFNQVGASLRRAGLLVGMLALVAALVAYLAGRPAWFERLKAEVRRITAPAPGGSILDNWVALHADVTRIAGLALAALILFWTGIDWIPVAVVALLVGLFLWGVASAEKRAGSVPEQDPG